MYFVVDNGCCRSGGNTDYLNIADWYDKVRLCWVKALVVVEALVRRGRMLLQVQVLVIVSAERGIPGMKWTYLCFQFQLFVVHHDSCFYFSLVRLSFLVTWNDHAACHLDHYSSCPPHFSLLSFCRSER